MHEASATREVEEDTTTLELLLDTDLLEEEVVEAALDDVLDDDDLTVVELALVEVEEVLEVVLEVVVARRTSLPIRSAPQR